jgi:hypothetical protein
LSARCSFCLSATLSLVLFSLLAFQMAFLCNTFALFCVDSDPSLSLSLLLTSCQLWDHKPPSPLQQRYTIICTLYRNIHYFKIYSATHIRFGIDRNNSRIYM